MPLSPEFHFTPQSLQQRLQQAVLTALNAAAKPRLLLALSGGLDSMVLLHVLAGLRETAGFVLSAAYVHHGLQKQADEWAAFCQVQTAVLKIDFQVCHVELTEPGRNIEQQARTLRYQALAALLDADTALLTAHHADDQLETILLALKRGSGLTGLSAIAAQKPFAGTVLLRPLLAFSRAELEQYASEMQLSYVSDPSNHDDSFDRNFLRQHVLPLLQQRFPAISQTTARSCQLLQQSLDYQRQQLAVELPALLRQQQLDLARLAERREPQRTLLLRSFLRRYDLAPSAEQCREFVQVFLESAPDAQPLLQWGDWQLRRFNGLLYLLDASEQLGLNTAPASGIRLLPEQQQQWQHWQFCWSLSAQAPAADWSSLPLALDISSQLEIRTGQLNQRFKPAGTSHSKALKDWCKLWEVPPWRRGSMPFIIAGQQKQIVAVPEFASHCSAAEAQSWLHYKK
ncbi:MAG: tRNA lysidine(34) synthetase TilS [Rheinheimera sp.]|nr:MAG: tRNA lysidine(34) synthetase TilS [Rheinheimera sp.]